jgi:hypothetical protein
MYLIECFIRLLDHFLLRGESLLVQMIADIVWTLFPFVLVGLWGEVVPVSERLRQLKCFLDSILAVLFHPQKALLNRLLLETLPHHLGVLVDLRAMRELLFFVPALTHWRMLKRGSDGRTGP